MPYSNKLIPFNMIAGHVNWYKSLALLLVANCFRNCNNTDLKETGGGGEVPCSASNSSISASDDCSVTLAWEEVVEARLGWEYRGLSCSEGRSGTGSWMDKREMLGSSDSSIASSFYNFIDY